MVSEAAGGEDAWFGPVHLAQAQPLNQALALIALTALEGGVPRARKPRAYLKLELRLPVDWSQGMGTGRAILCDSE